MLGRVCCVGLCVIGIFCGVTQGRTVYVDHNASGNADGTTWADAYTTLQAALADNGTPAVTVIKVAQGTYKPANQSSYFALRSGLEIQGGYNAALEVQNWTLYETYLSGDIDGDDVPSTWSDYDDNCYNVVKANGVGSSAILDGFYIIGGNDDDGQEHGGGLEIYNASPKIRNCSFEDNQAYAAGAVYVHGESGYTAAPTFTNCTFKHNRAYGTANTGGNGGAVYCSLNTNGATFDDCVFEDNTSVTGGGALSIRCDDDGNGANVIVSMCRFEGNEGSTSASNFNDNPGGGAAEVIGKTDAYFVNCKFYDNSAGSLAKGGGAVYVGRFYRGGETHGDAGNPTFMNCAFVGNTAPHGAAFCSTNDEVSQTSGDGPQIINCTFSHNSTAGTTGEGGGLYCSSSDTTNYYPRVYNSIFWHNEDGDSVIDEDSQITVSSAGGAIDVQHTFVEDCVTTSGGYCYDAGDDNIGDGVSDTPSFISDPNPASSDYGNLKLGSTSICVEAGDNAKIADDLADLNGNSATAEDTPIDLDSDLRTLDGDNNATSTVDMGAYEFFADCNSNEIPEVCDLSCSGDCNTFYNGTCGESYDCNTDGDQDDCCPWDLDYSGFVGTGDENLIKANYGCNIATEDYCDCGRFDLDGSGVIGTGDVNVVKANYGACP